LPTPGTCRTAKASGGGAVQDGAAHGGLRARRPSGGLRVALAEWARSAGSSSAGGSISGLPRPAAWCRGPETGRRHGAWWTGRGLTPCVLVSSVGSPDEATPCHPAVSATAPVASPDLPPFPSAAKHRRRPRAGSPIRRAGIGSAIIEMRDGGMRETPCGSRHGFSRRVMLPFAGPVLALRGCPCSTPLFHSARTPQWGSIRQVSQDLSLRNHDRMVWLESKEPPVVECE
jgi:hypothetical protein